jgi:endoglucanase
MEFVFLYIYLCIFYVYIFIEALKRVKGKTDIGLYLATTVGEETTGRGASSSIQKVNPNCAISIDVTYASDLPYREHLTNDVYLGKGAALTEGSLMNKIIHKKCIDICKEKQIPYQIEVAPGRTFTDTDTMHSYFEGTPCYLISIPLLYMHSSVEVCDLKDVDHIIDLVVEFILSFDKNQTFNPFE